MNTGRRGEQQDLALLLATFLQRRRWETQMEEIVGNVKG